MIKVHTGLLISKSSSGFKLLPVPFKAGVWRTVLKGPSDKQENCYEWLFAFLFVYDSVCLHSMLLNWLRNRLEIVLLLYTSHNSPSHQSWAIFYLEDDVSIRVCQPLTAALWVVVLGESIVNQHNNNNNRISVAGTCTSLGCGTAVHQVTAHPEHTQEQAHRHTRCLSISLALFHFLFSRIFTHTNTKFRDLTKSDNRYAEKRQNLAKGSVSVSSSSPVSVFHQRYEGPIRFCCQSGNTFSPQTQNWGSFKDWSPMAPSPLCYCLH